MCHLKKSYLIMSTVIYALIYLTSWIWDLGTLHCLNGQTSQDVPRTSLDFLDLGFRDLTLPPWPDIPGHLGPGNQGPCTASVAQMSQQGSPGLLRTIPLHKKLSPAWPRHPSHRGSAGRVPESQVQNGLGCLTVEAV